MPVERVVRWASLEKTLNLFDADVVVDVKLLNRVRDAAGERLRLAVVGVAEKRAKLLAIEAF